MKDFFISYNTKDEQWAEWIAWQIEELKFSTMMQRWDFATGSNFVLEMNKAVDYASKIILVLSNNFLQSRFTSPEWAAFFSKDPDGSRRLIIPIRIGPCTPTGLLAQIVYLDLVNRNALECRELVRKALDFQRSKPNSEPDFPQTDNLCSLLSEAEPTLGKPYGNRKNAPKRIAKKIYTQFFEKKFAPFHIHERRFGRAFLSEILDHLVKLHFNSPNVLNNVSMIITDVDGMSGINKSHGVAVGDNVIRNIVEIICREPSRLLSGRMGDDTIFCILVNTSELEAKYLSERITREIAAHNWNSLSDGLFVTCSTSFVQFVSIERVEDSIVRAALGVKNARMRGGNRAEAPPPGTNPTDFTKILKNELMEEFEAEKRARWLSISS
jgi:diguanylate cyclase (GGDEF)-like protein